MLVNPCDNYQVKLLKWKIIINLIWASFILYSCVTDFTVIFVSWPVLTKIFSFSVSFTFRILFLLCCNHSLHPPVFFFFTLYHSFHIFLFLFLILYLLFYYFLSPLHLLFLFNCWLLPTSYEKYVSYLWECYC